MTVRTLVLSGGGGRGAFHAGVFKYLMQPEKSGIASTHQGVWQPDIVVGTSIGAVNGAAIAQGISAVELEEFWLSLRETDVQGLPPGMGVLARRAVNAFLKRSIGVYLPQVAPARSMSPPAAEAWPPIPILPRWIAERFIGRWSNLLDTGPLHETLANRLKIDPQKLAASPTTLLISATNIRTGEGVTFSNHPMRRAQDGAPMPHIREGITVKRIIASCSIPMVYPWTRDDDGEVYWDGALVANTPLGAAFDAARDRPREEPMEVIIVMMNPWLESNNQPQAGYDRLPDDFGEVITWTLDWAMLASFRVSLKMLRAFNELSQMDMAQGKTPRYRPVTDVIVAPERFLPVERIIDYDEPASRALIDLGYAAAERALRAHFGATEA
ncbi:MAG: hypothetical protein HC915_03295 [Anaerolineae bacterium]|nr:hypothetical protein [Anaerolineae bacterium]